MYELHPELSEALKIARDIIQIPGLTIEGLHYFRSEEGHPFQKKMNGIAICFDATTSNENFFGMPYENWRRIKLIDVLYTCLGEHVGRLFPNFEVYLDMYVRLDLCCAPGLPAFGSAELRKETPDVTVNSDVYFVEHAELLRSGQIETGCTLDVYNKRYGIDKVLKHGWHCISPDSSSVEMFEALCDTTPIRSVLEIGGGVGICGVAAGRRGIKDYTFVDVSPTVCDYLRGRFPQYEVIQASGLKFDFSRHYDVVLCGMPYELNPWFLEKRGIELASWSDAVVLQSGLTCFFEFEHDWIFGDVGYHWPWRNRKQELIEYFPNIFGSSLDWQTVLVGFKSIRMIDAWRNMQKRGFTDIRYEYLKGR